MSFSDPRKIKTGHAPFPWLYYSVYIKQSEPHIFIYWPSAATKHSTTRTKTPARRSTNIHLMRSIWRVSSSKWSPFSISEGLDFWYFETCWPKISSSIIGFDACYQNMKTRGAHVIGTFYLVQTKLMAHIIATFGHTKVYDYVDLRHCTTFN